MKDVLSSSVVLLNPSSQLTCDSPWIVCLLEIEGETHLFHPLFEEEDEDYINEYLNLQSYVLPYYLSLRYHITEEKFRENFSWSRGKHDKVLIFALSIYQSFPLMINNCSLLVLYKWGQLSGFRPQTKYDDDIHVTDDERFDISYDNVDKFDDIICFKGIVYALDQLGKLYKISTSTFRVEKVVIDKPDVKVESTIIGCRKRLVGSILDETLYLIVRDDFEDELRVYKMMFYKTKIYWIEVHSFVDSDQVLFLSRIDGYFVAASEFSICNLKNCIIFYDAFPSYFHTSRKFHKKVKVEKEIQVFWLGRNIRYFRPISSYPEFPAANIFSPPNWMLQTCQSPSLRSKCRFDDVETESGSTSQEKADEETSGSIKSLSDGHAEGMLTDSSGESSSDDEKDEMQLDSPNQSSEADDNNGTAESEEEDEEEIQRSSSSEQCDVQPNFSDEATNNDLHSSPLLTPEYEKNNTGTFKMNNEKNTEDLDSSTPNFHGQDFSTEKVSNNANSTHSTPTLVPLACINCSSTVKFEGVDIKAELLPTLETIWVKQGSLISEATVRNKKIRACALELLAKLVISLQNTTGRSLIDSQANDIRSVMFDLQLVGLKVDWLTPIVDKALKLQRNKALIEAMMLLDKKKAQIEKEEKEFLARNAKVKQEIEDDMASLSAKVPFPEIIDLDDCLGGGLF